MPAKSKLKTAVERRAGMSEDAVQAKTGRGWSQWYALLDRAGAKQMTHRDIAKMLHAEHDITFWWAQTVTVAYERERGLRQKHEKPDGFDVSRSRTLGVSRAKLFDAWKSARTRNRWLEERVRIRKAIHSKSLRATWEEDGTHVNVYFTSKGRGRSQVTVQHTKLENARSAERVKKAWGARLDRLQEHLEGRP